MPGAGESPFAVVALGAIHDVDDSDETTLSKFGRQCSIEADFPKEFESGGIELEPGVNEEGAAVIGAARSIVDVLMAGDDRPRPGLLDGDRAQWLGHALSL